MTRINKKLLAIILLAMFVAFVALSLAADSVGIANQIRDTETGNPAKIQLIDRGDGVKMIGVVVLPSPTPSATFTPTPTPTPTPTA